MITSCLSNDDKKYIIFSINFSWILFDNEKKKKFSDRLFWMLRIPLDWNFFSTFYRSSGGLEELYMSLFMTQLHSNFKQEIYFRFPMYFNRNSLKSIALIYLWYFPTIGNHYFCISIFYIGRQKTANFIPQNIQFIQNIKQTFYFISGFNLFERII